MDVVVDNALEFETIQRMETAGGVVRDYAEQMQTYSKSYLYFV